MRCLQSILETVRTIILILLRVLHYPLRRTSNSWNILSFTADFIQISTTKSTRKRKRQKLSAQEMETGCRLGMDSHADVNCVGRHAHISEVFLGRTCNDSYAPMKDIFSINACVAHDTKMVERSSWRSIKLLILLIRWSTRFCALISVGPMVSL